MRRSGPLVAVVGLGAIGAASAWHAAAAGARVIGFERFELGHHRGASHGRSRIIRRSYHSPHYVELTARAYEAWADVEAAAGTALIAVTGGLDLFPVGAAIDPVAYLDSLAACGVAHEWLDGTEVRRRWPAFLVGDDVRAIYQPDAGIVPADRATAALLQLAAGAGADLRPHTEVRSIAPNGSGLDIVTDSRTVPVDAAIVAADAWTSRLLGPLGVNVPLEVTLEQVTYLTHPRIERLEPAQLPVWIWMDDPSYYGFPVFGPPGVVKVAEDCGGPRVDPDRRTFAPDAVREAELCRFTDGLLGGPVRVDHSVTCIYTLTADRDLVVDRLPELPRIAVGLGAAHGFKFAPWIGRALAALALGEEVGADLTPFSISRAGLHRPATRQNWLV